MDSLLSMRVFSTVAIHHSFSAAARQMGLSPAMITKHIAHLEARLGARVFNRTTRRVSLTEAGRQYLSQCQDALDLIDAAEASISNATSRPSGTLRVTAPVWFAHAGMTQLLVQYQRQYPDVILDMQLENRRVDLAGEGYDVALRATADPSPALIVKPLAVVPFYLVASPVCFPGGRPPTSVRELSAYRAVLPSYVSIDRLSVHTDDGPETLALTPGMYCNDTNMMRHAVLAGSGLAYLPAWMIGDDLKTGKLVRVLPGHRTAPITLYAAYSSRRYLTSKVRTFIDFMSDALPTLHNGD